MNIRKAVEAVNDSDYKVYLAITGGGSKFVSDFLTCGGGSNTILGVTIPYSQKCFDEFLGWVPEKYVSPVAAEGLALQSYLKANGYNQKNNLGIGVSASLTKGTDEREGRKNLSYVSVVADDYVANHVFDLTGTGNRESQEELLSYLIMAVLVRNTTPAQIVLKETVEYELLNVDNTVYFNKDIRKEKFVFPGSFNPFHHGHKRILRDVEDVVGETVYCELSVTNADKRIVLPSELAERIYQFECDSNRSLLIVNAPRFDDKIELYPRGTTFVVGADTFERILSLAYDDYDDLYTWVYAYDIEFIIVPRDGKTWTSIVQKFVDDNGPELWYGSYERHGIRPLISKYQEKIDKGSWPVNISSTQIRNGELYHEG